MQTATASEEVQEDIDINTREGLQAFSQYAKDAYGEIIEIFKSHSGESSHENLEKVSRFYEALNVKIALAVSLKEENLDVGEVLAEEIQTLYNELLDILDGEVEHDVIEVSVPQPPIEILPQKDETHTEVPMPSWAQTAKLDQSSSAEVTPVASVVESLLTIPSSVIESADSSLLEQEVPAESGVLHQLHESVAILASQTESLLEKYKEISEVESSDVVLNVGQHYYKQLGITYERVQRLQKSIVESEKKDGVVSQLVVEHFEDAVEEITDNLLQLDKGLNGFFESDLEDAPLDVEVKKPVTGQIGVSKEESSDGKNIPITLVKKPEPAPVVRKHFEAQAIHNTPVRPATNRVERAFKTELGNVIEKVLKIPRYAQFAATTFPSPVQCEAMIRREIQRIETPSKFDSVFGISNKSAFFDLLSNMTVREVVDFDNQPRDVIRESLHERDIKYEVYLDWIDSLNSMLSMTHAHPTLTFAELFVRAELEVLLQHDESMAA